MRFGQMFWQQTPDFSISHDVRINEALQHAVRCEDLGFDTVWFAEQHFTNYGYSPNPLLLAAIVAARTSRIRVGTAVVALPLWNPIRLAEDVAVVDIISNGRIDVGIGKGYQHIGFRGFNVERGDRNDLFQETLDFLVQAWTTNDSKFSGEHLHYPNGVNVFPKPVQQPHPPIWAAVTSDENIRWVAKTDFTVLGSANWASPEQGKADHDLYLEERRKAGKTDDKWVYALNRVAHVVESDADRAQEWDRFAARCRHTFRLARRLRWDTVRYDHGYVHPDPLEEKDEETDEQIAARTLFGTPAQVVEQILKLNEVLDVGMLITQMDVGGATFKEVESSQELFGTKVIPAVRAALGE